MYKLHGINISFLKKFKEIDVNYTLIFFIRNFIGTLKLTVEAKKAILDVYNWYLWICNGNVYHRFSTNEKLKKILLQRYNKFLTADDE